MARSKAIILSIAFTVITGSSVLIAQPGSNPGGGVRPGTPVPISGIEWLLISGGLLGSRKIYQTIKNRRQV